MSAESSESRAVPSARGGPAPAGRAPKRRSWLEVRWRQFRNAPPPVTRAIGANLAVAIALALPLFAYDQALRAGAALPGGDLRTAAVAVYVAAVLGAGSVVTYLWVPLPSGASGLRRRTWWSAALGAFAAVPIVYLVLVVLFQIAEPLLSS